jgi:hypothetical protein
VEFLCSQVFSPSPPYICRIFLVLPYAPYTYNKVTKLFSSNNLTNHHLGLILFAITFLFFFALNIDSGPIVLG